MGRAIGNGEFVHAPSSRGVVRVEDVVDGTSYGVPWYVETRVLYYRTDLVETRALREFTLHVGAGEFVAITGPSGSGKSTFLNVAGLLDTFDQGKYFLDGLDVSRLSDQQMSRIRNEKIGFIFQSFNLIPDLNLFDNVDVPLRYRGLGAADLAALIG